MLKKLLLSLLVAVPVVAQADWMEWGKDDEFVTYIDPDRTVKTYETLEQAEVWLKMVVHTDLSKDGLSVGDHRLVKYGVKCRTNELGFLAYYAYKKTKLIDSYVFRSPQYEPVIPDSKGEEILYVVCAALYGQEESWISKAPTQLKVGAFVIYNIYWITTFSKSLLLKYL